MDQQRKTDGAAMSILSEFFSSEFPTNPVEAQDAIAAALPRILANTPLSVREPGDPIPTGSVVIVGVTPSWNWYDQRLLVALEEGADNFAGEIVIVDLLETEEAISDLESLTPGMVVGNPGPYVSVWVDGSLQHATSGPAAAAYVANRYALKYQ